MSHVFSVTELTQAIKDVVELQFPFIWVRGQVSSLSRPGSGHIYFTLKDEQAGLQVVWFKQSQPFSRQQGSDPAATLESGQEVMCAGRIGVYAPRGTYQLIAELVQEQGLGDLFLAFEAMKKKLQGLGYFDQERKRPIPFCPDRVGIVTAPTGAVIHDFMRVARDRGLGGSIRVYPSQVQGDRAPKDLARAVRLANEQGWAEVVVLMRGGGSLEDLWAFNEEEVARAVFESKIPVLTAIGHETDTTIADLTADKRVATPSHAAQSLWPETKDMILRVDEMEAALFKSYSRFLDACQGSLEHLSKALGWLSPAHRLQRVEDRLRTVEGSLLRSGKDLLEKNRARLDDLDDRLSSRFGPEFWEIKNKSLDYLESRLSRSGQALLKQKESILDLASERLAGLDPYGPLNRGYAMVTVERTSKFLRSVRDTRPGDSLEITVIDGSVQGRVVDETGDDH